MRIETIVYQSTFPNSPLEKVVIVDNQVHCCAPIFTGFVPLKFDYTMHFYNAEQRKKAKYIGYMVITEGKETWHAYIKNNLWQEVQLKCYWRQERYIRNGFFIIAIASLVIGFLAYSGRGVGFWSSSEEKQKEKVGKQQRIYAPLSGSARKVTSHKKELKKGNIVPAKANQNIKPH